MTSSRFRQPLIRGYVKVLARLLFFLPLFFLTPLQGQVVPSLKDSTVTILSNGDLLTTYSSKDYFFLPQNNDIPYSDPYLIDYNNSQLLYQNVLPSLGETAVGSNVSNGCVVGAIPFSISTTPSGGRTYNVPISIVSESRFSPAISVYYNSQMGEGIAGYGWSINGLSSIALSAKNRIFYDTISSAVVNDSDAAYALDGVAILPSYDSNLDDYPFLTVQGNIRVKKNTGPDDVVSHFSVLYPDGRKSTFGWSDGSGPGYLFPLTYVEDLEGRKIIISYDCSDNVCRPLSIEYDFDEDGSAHGRIEFSYSPRQSCVVYCAGVECKSDKILSSITSYNGTSIIAKYDFEYEFKHGTMLLSSICLGNGDECYNPLRFSYNEEPSTQDFIQDSHTILASAFTGDAPLINKRGCFVQGEPFDGIISLPNLSNYTVVRTYTKKILWMENTFYEFGSGYNPNQRILIAPRLNNFSSTITITAEEGFQTIEALDVDKDGVDEIVKVNFNGLDGDNTILRLKIYKFDSTATQLDSSYFDVPVKGVVADGEHMKSPMQRLYYWGRFNNTGHVQLLTISFNKDFRGRERDSFTTVIDLTTQSKSEYQLFDLSSNDAYKYLVYDMDNDGKTDVCLANPVGLQHFYCDDYGVFTQDKVVSGLNSEVLHEAMDRYVYLGDMNGDGYLDLVKAPRVGYWEKYYPYLIPDDSGSGLSTTPAYRLVRTNNVWDIYSFTGESFVKRTSVGPFNDYGNEFMIMDVNHDGLSDIVKIVNGIQFYGTRDSVLVYPNCYGEFNLNNEIQTSVTFPVPNSRLLQLLPANILNKGRESQFIVLKDFYVYTYQFSEDRSLSRSVIRCEDSYGNVGINTYLKATNGNVYQRDPLRSYSLSGGFFKQVVPINVLYRSTALENGSRILSDVVYTYYDAAINNQGLGFSGFGKTRAFDLVSEAIVIETRDPEHFGVVTQIASSKSNSEDFFSVITNNYDYHSELFNITNPRLTESVAYDALSGVTTTTQVLYDDYDFPIRTVTGSRIGSGAPITSTCEHVYEHSIVPSKYVLGIVIEESTIRECDGDGLFSWKNRTVYTYDDKFHPLSRKDYVGKYGWSDTLPEGLGVSLPEGEEPLPQSGVQLFLYDAWDLVSETRWAYDTYGNVTSERTAPYGGMEFVGKTYTYDADGRYLLSETDALGNTISYSGYNKFGKPTTVTDFLNGATTYTYDGFGKLTETTYPDGSVETTSVSWGGDGLYTVSSTATGKPEAVVHYDAQGREIKSGVKRFDGQWQWTDKEYDGKGRLYRTSLPYRDDSLYWNTYHYDQYNRPDSLIEASGKVSTWAYSGTSVTSVCDGIASTKTTDAAGNVVSVTDAGGTITYSYRDDGQLSSVCAPGNVVTSFSYDEYGRKTSMTDPSAGLQTEAYLWNADGSAVFTHTNPNGTIRTYKDKYGRTTMVERPGEYNTLYNYDSYGRVSSEQSTNGTGTEYAYDNLGRIAWAKETVPDGKWLKKAYTYGLGSTLASTQYTSQSGLITTETYSYANGYNTGVNLTDGTVVWSLESENDLGMATEITSGSINRQYGFTPFGMPTYRKMDDGVLQDFTYQFDNHTGNLLLRQDGVNGHIETFGYDGLNRLTDMGNRHVSYAQNGNISSISGVGLMYYENPSKPYQLTTLGFVGLDDIGNVANRQQSITYTCYSRPSILIEGERSAAFTYNGTGDRVKMYVAEGTTPVLTRYYVGGQYEYDQTPGGTKERLYLDGDAYSSPMVLQRENGGSWTAYNIGRDYLGNITHIATLDGTLVAEYSYDPWGRLRNPSTLEIYAPGSEPELFLGRGFTGHEHMTWFGLINMNARLYDPLLGRFLSPDPYVQAPDFTQNFNRYSYCLNNPLKYTDDSGKSITLALLIVGAHTALGGFAGYTYGWLQDVNSEKLKQYVLTGACIGFVSGLSGVALGATGVSPLLLQPVEGVISAAGFTGMTTDWDKIEMFKASAFALAAGFAGGIVGGAWGGPIGAMMSSVTTRGIQGLLSDNKDWRPVIFAGLSSLLTYYAVTYASWKLSDEQLVFNNPERNTKFGIHIKYRTYLKLNAQIQRSRFYHKEYGGYISLEDGSYTPFPSDLCHKYNIEISRMEPDGPSVAFHTHWDKNRFLGFTYEGKFISNEDYAFMLINGHRPEEFVEHYAVLWFSPDDMTYSNGNMPLILANRIGSAIAMSNNHVFYAQDFFLRYFPYVTF